MFVSTCVTKWKAPITGAISRYLFEVKQEMLTTLIARILFSNYC